MIEVLNCHHIHDNKSISTLPLLNLTEYPDDVVDRRNNRIKLLLLLNSVISLSQEENKYLFIL